MQSEDGMKRGERSSQSRAQDVIRRYLELLILAKLMDPLSYLLV